MRHLRTTRWSLIDELLATRLLAAGLTMACSGTAMACAHPPPHPAYQVVGPSASPVRARWVSLALSDEYGRPLAQIDHHGQHYVAGQAGTRYVMTLINHSAARLEVVVTVDGRDVVSGELGDYRGQRGYVLEPYAKITIDGYRRSMAEVAAFRFSDATSSYSAQLGTPQHVGVIGLAVFREARRWRQPAQPAIAWQHADKAASAECGPGCGASMRKGKSSSGSPSPAAGAESMQRESADEAAAPARGQMLGTAYGESRQSTARWTAFVRRHPQRADAVSVLYYDTPQGLAQRGVPVWFAPSDEPLPPQAFPGVTFAEPPPNDSYSR